MDPKIMIIIAVSYLYGFSEVVMNLRQGRKSKVISSRDKGSLWLLYGLITLGYALSFAIGATKTGRMHAWNTFFAIGMALIAIGLVIRIYSILTLKQYFTYSVATVENHKIIETGLYKFIRHPGYLGQLTDLPWNFNFHIKLVVNSGHADPGYAWISLPDKSGGKVYG